MKIKIDFVSNSSCTSFLVADFRKNKKTLLSTFKFGKKEIKVDLFKRMGYNKFNDLKKFKKEFSWRAEGFEEEVKNVFDKNGTLYYIWGYDFGFGGDDPIVDKLVNRGIKKGKFPKGIEIIDGGGGY
jgi:hypothetical protein